MRNKKLRQPEVDKPAHACLEVQVMPFGGKKVTSVCFRFPSSIQTAKAETLQTAKKFTVATRTHFFWGGELALKAGLWVPGILNYLSFLLLGFLQTIPAMLMKIVGNNEPSLNR